MSAANAAVEHVRDWLQGTPEGEYVSMGVISTGEYGVEPGLVYSYPLTTSGFDYQVVQGLTIDATSQERMTLTENELKEEKAEALA